MHMLLILWARVPDALPFRKNEDHQSLSMVGQALTGKWKLLLVDENGLIYFRKGNKYYGHAKVA